MLDIIKKRTQDKMAKYCSDLILFNTEAMFPILCSLCLKKDLAAMEKVLKKDNQNN